MTGTANECWVATEGAAGMENQCLGLAERLSLPVRTFRIALRPFWKMIAPVSFGSALGHLDPKSPQLAPPWPRILIGCGRQSIPVVLAVKKLSNGETLAVQCQDPRVSLSKFDLVIPPVHDGLSGPNVFSIVGSPNRITPSRLAAARQEFASLFAPLAAPRIAVLVGGRSRTHGVFGPADAARLAGQLVALAPRHGIMVSTSRRTDPAVAATLREALPARGTYFWDGNGLNPYLGMLAWADSFIVTADSVNMICEAAGTGRPVHVAAVTGSSAKADRFQQSLRERGIIRPFSGKLEQWDYAPLEETARAAQRIKSLLDDRKRATDIR